MSGCWRSRRSQAEIGSVCTRAANIYVVVTGQWSVCLSVLKSSTCNSSALAQDFRIIPPASAPFRSRATETLQPPSSSSCFLDAAR